MVTGWISGVLFQKSDFFFLFNTRFRTDLEPISPIYYWIPSSRIKGSARFLFTYFNPNSKLMTHEASAPFPPHTSMTWCLETGTIPFNYFCILF